MSDTEQQDSGEQPEAQASVVPVESLDEDQTIAFNIVQECCEASGLGAHAVVRTVNRPYLSIEMLGGDVRATLGKMGQGVDALQFLLNTIISRRVKNDVRLLLDAEGYRERRADALRKRALDLAAEVKERKEEAELEPLPAHERRIIHAALADDPDILTYSEGDEPARRVVIAPRVAGSE